MQSECKVNCAGTNPLATYLLIATVRSIPSLPQISKYVRSVKKCRGRLHEDHAGRFGVWTNRNINAITQLEPQAHRLQLHKARTKRVTSNMVIGYPLAMMARHMVTHRP